jgi:hypothetical protein
MKHLHDAEFVDLIEGTLSAERVAHVTTCEACRAQVDAMNSSLASARVAPPADPSPLFWQHFTTRVNARIDASEPARPWWSVPRLAMTAAALVLAALAAFNFLAPANNGASTPIASQETPAADSGPGFVGLDDIEADEGWAVVRAAAEDLDADAAAEAGLSAGPGAVDQVASQLTDAERAELVRLVEDEIKRSGA